MRKDKKDEKEDSQIADKTQVVAKTEETKTSEL